MYFFDIFWLYFVAFFDRESVEVACTNLDEVNVDKLDEFRKYFA